MRFVLLARDPEEDAVLLSRGESEAWRPGIVVPVALLTLFVVVASVLFAAFAAIGGSSGVGDGGGSGAGVGVRG